MAYKIENPYELIEVEVGDRRAVLEADLSVSAVTDFGVRLKKTMAAMKVHEPLVQKAAREGNVKKMAKLNAQAQASVEDACAAIVGECGVREFKEACFPGRRQALRPVLGLLRVLDEAVKGAGERYRQQGEKAAHYLSEVRVAQADPDPSTEQAG